jgi:hypothetical protein
MLCRTTSNAEPHGDGAKSPASEGPLKPNWPTYTTTTTDREGRPLPTFTRASQNVAAIDISYATPQAHIIVNVALH